MPRRTPAARRSRLASLTRSAFEPLEPRTLLSAAITKALDFGNNSSAGDRVTDMVTNSIGTTYVTGYFSNSMDVDPSDATVTLTSNGGQDVFLAAFKDGALVWAKSFGGSGNDTPGGLLLLNSNLVLSGTFSGSFDADPGAGTTTLTSNGGTDAFILHFSNAGAFTSAQSIGGTGNDTAGRMALDLGVGPNWGTSDFYLLGTFQGTVDLDPGLADQPRTATNPDGDTFLARINPLGNAVFINTYAAGNNPGEDFRIANVGVDPLTNRLYIAGQFKGEVDLYSGAGSLLISSSKTLGFIAEYNSNGIINWAHTFGEGTGPYSTITVNDFAVSSSGALVIGGSFGGTIDVDPSTDVHNLVETQSPDGLTGFVLTLNREGKYAWAGALTGDSWSDVYAVEADAAGNVYLAGMFNHITDFDFGATARNVTAPNTLNTAFIAKYDASGNFLWEKHTAAASGTSRAFVISIGILTAQDHLAVAGDFTNNATFQTATGDSPLTADATGDNFVLFLTQSKDTPALVLTPSSSTAVVDQHITLTAKFTVPAGVPGGSVTFYDGDTAVGEASIGANGTAVFTWVAKAGSHTFTAHYEGDANFAAVTSAAVAINAAGNQLPTGNLDHAGFGMLAGWVADRDDPAAPLVVHILVDGVLRASFLAKANRPDLQAAVGNANHGFAWQLPPLAAGTHTVELITFDPHTQLGKQIAFTTVTSSHLYFDEAWYLRTNPDVAAAVSTGAMSSAWFHYQAAGAREGRNPSTFFNEKWYLAQNPDVAAAVNSGELFSGFRHFASTGSREGRDPSPFFSESFYRRAYTDVAGAINAGTLSSGFTHFLASGLLEGRSPSAWFDAADYRARYTDVDAGLGTGTLRTAFDHFVIAGAAEKRAPSPHFDEAFYLTQNPDVAAAVTNGGYTSGFAHFVTVGLNEGRLSQSNFDANWYMSQYPTVAQSLQNGTVKSPFQHYLLYGRLTGNLPHA